jgi:hypothetical protein
MAIPARETSPIEDMAGEKKVAARAATSRTPNMRNCNLLELQLHEIS